MKLENVERFIEAGWNLTIVPRQGQFHAYVGNQPRAHNFIGVSVGTALAYLDHYLSDKGVGYLEERIPDQVKAK